MSTNDFKREMEQMLTAIERQVTLSLRKIKQCFESSDRSMDEDFRIYFLRKSNQRLEASYSNVKWEQNREEDHSKNSERQASDRRFTQETLTNGRNTANASTDALNLQSSQNESTPNANTFALVIKEEPQSVDLNASEIGKDSNENSPNVVIDCGNNGREDEHIPIKEEPNVEVKLEPIEEEVPMRRFMASEVDSNERPSSIDNDTNSNGNESLLESRSMQKICESIAPKPSCSTVANRFKCKQCEYATTHKGNLNLHMRKHTGEKPFRCDRCSKRYTTNQNLRKHMTTHKDVFPFHCAGCFRGFFQENEKKDHEESCGYRRYECYVCKKYTTTKKTQLEIHMRIHTGEQPFRCSRCSKSYKRLNPLKIHMATHKNRKLLFHCIGCLRRFATQGQKLTHQYECHIRRYECHLCKTYVTIYKSHLKSHMRSNHTGQKPFRCEICMKCFTTKSYLKTHLNTIHNKK